MNNLALSYDYCYYYYFFFFVGMVVHAKPKAKPADSCGARFQKGAT